MRSKRNNWLEILVIIFLSILMATIFFLPEIIARAQEREAVYAEEFGCEETELDGMAEAELEYYTKEPYPEEPFEEEKTEAAILSKANRIDGVLVTFYSIDSCGKSPDDPWYGITSTGVKAQPYHTLAVDPKVIPYGASVAIDYGDGNLQYYFAEDCGGAIKGKHVDVCLENNEDCFQMGRIENTTLWWWFEE